MSGETALSTLLTTMRPKLINERYVFSTLTEVNYSLLAKLNPIATFQEQEGLSVVITQSIAKQFNLDYSGVFNCITLTVHSSLNAVGLTAAIASKLAKHSISANVIAAHYHDHVFVPVEDASQAMFALEELSQQNTPRS
jgi:hypothetical protein